MPRIDDVTLDVREESGNSHNLVAIWTATIAMTKLETCWAQHCLEGLNEEFEVWASICAADPPSSPAPYIFLGRQNVIWQSSDNVSTIEFKRLFPKGRELNEDSIFGFGLRDELVPLAELWSRTYCSQLAKKFGDQISGHF